MAIAKVTETEKLVVTTKIEIDISQPNKVKFYGSNGGKDDELYRNKGFFLVGWTVSPRGEEIHLWLDAEKL